MLLSAYVATERVLHKSIPLNPFVGCLQIRSIESPSEDKRLFRLHSKTQLSITTASEHSSSGYRTGEEPRSAVSYRYFIPWILSISHLLSLRRTLSGI